MKNIIKKIRFTAILLSLTTLFALFTGSVYAGNLGSAYIADTVLVIEDGKVISGDKSLVDSGIVVIGGDHNAEPGMFDTDVKDTTTDNSVSAPSDTESDAGTDTGSDSAQTGNRPIKDNSAIISPDSGEGNDIDTQLKTEPTLPNETPTAVNPNLPEESAKGSSYINYPSLGAAQDSWTTITLYEADYHYVYVYQTQKVQKSNVTISELTYRTSDTDVGIYRLKDAHSSRGPTGTGTFSGTMFEVTSGKTFNLTGTSSYGLYIDGRLCSSYASGSSSFLPSTPAAVSRTNPQVSSSIMKVSGSSAFLNLTYTDIRYGNSSKDGAGLYIGNGGKATLKHCTIHDCVSAGNGGAIYIESGGKLTMEAVEIRNCKAAYGGAIYVAGSATLSFTDVNIHDNEATGNGGGFWFGPSTSGFTLNSEVTLQDNKAGHQGGAIALARKATLTINGADIYSNDAAYGGGIACYAHSTHQGDPQLILNSGQIRGNTATTAGGGIYIDSGSEHQINNTTTTANSSSIHDNTAPNGAGIYVAKTIYTGATNGKVTINQGKLYANQASGYGGAVYVADGGTLVFSGGTTAPIGLIGADNASSGNRAAYGAGVYVAPGGSFTMNSGEIKNNGHATDSFAICNYGGGLYSEGGTIQIKGGTFSGNTAKYGGGFNVDLSASVTISGGEIYSNTVANNGGGGWIGSVSKFEMTGGKVYLNTAPAAYPSGIGGGLFFNRGVAQGAISLTGGEIYQNTSEYRGGGIYFGNGETGSETFYAAMGGVSGKTLKIYQNTSKTGGGICVDDGQAVPSYTNVTIGTGVEIYSNTATAPYSDGLSGGGIFVAPSGVITMTGGSIYSNTGSFGAGVCLNGGSLTMSDGEISNNNAGSGHGGGVLVAGSTTFTFQGGTITGNAAENGGGVYVSTQSTFNQTGGYITSNGANTAGGGVNVKGAYNLSGGNIYKNNCANGGGIAVLDGATLTMTGGTIGDTPENTNIATVGGGVYLFEGGTFNMSNGTIQNHRNIQDGGAVAVYGAFTMSGGTITGNYATENGGGIMVNTNDDGAAATSPATVLITGGTISGNYNTGTYDQGGGNGGGIWVGICKKFEMTGGSITGNHTQKAGGNGAGIFVNRAVDSFSITGGTISNNICEGDASKGGGICISNSSMATATTITIKNISLISNKANLGGGFFANGNDDRPTLTVALEDITVQKNIAISGGGGIYVVGSTLNATITGNNVIGGSAENANVARSGGGIMVEACVLNITGTADEHTSITYNKTSTDDTTGALAGGGGVYTYNGTLNMSYGSISHNNANDNSSVGGGVCAYGGNIALTNVLVQSNETDTKYGGGIYCGAYDGSGGNISLTNCTLDSNSSMYGGGAFITNGSSITVAGGTITGNTAEESGGVLVYSNSTGTFSDVTVSGNSTTNGDGGGLMAAINSTITATDCFIINNTANGSYTGATAKVEEHTLVGAGGGVAVFDNSSFSLTVSEGGAGAIYGNTAATAGNDVFANGNGTSLTIPAPDDMDTSASGIEDGLWWEDYLEKDTSYAQGLNGDARVIYRYKDTPISIRAYTSNAEGSSPSGRYVNDGDQFVAITFDVPKYTVGSIKIQAPTATDENQRFVFTVTGETMLGEKVSLTISVPAGESVTIDQFLPGTYTVTQQTDWSWRYSFNGVTLNGNNVESDGGAVDVTVTGTSVDELHTVSYDNARDVNIWLDHNSTAHTNKAVLPTELVYTFDAAEAKRSYVL